LHGICRILQMIFAAFVNFNLPLCRMVTFHFGSYLKQKSREAK
jgi:hypothetical protein